MTFIDIFILIKNLTKMLSDDERNFIKLVDYSNY